MRIDKFLWCVRFYKTRSVSAEEIKKNRVSVSGQSVKSSKEVKVGDRLKIRKNQIDYQIQILQIPKSRVGAKLVPDYIADKTEKDQYEILKLRLLNQEHYRNKGEGRPTKKDRRDIDGFVGTEKSGPMEEGDWDLFFSDVEDLNAEGDV